MGIPKRTRPVLWRTLERDFEKNGGVLKAKTFLRGLLVPDRFGAVTWMRLYQRFQDRPLVRRLAYRVLLHAHGLEMDRDVRIGAGLFLPHPRGVMFAEGTELGENVAVYGMVRFLANERGAPRVENGAFLGDGVRILGRIVVGENSRVGAGSVVTRNIPAGVSAAGVPARVLNGERPKRARREPDVASKG